MFIFSREFAYNHIRYYHPENIKYRSKSGTKMMAMWNGPKAVGKAKFVDENF